MRPDPQKAEDVAAASAAYLYNVLPSILKEEPSEAFRRLAAHFETAILAYTDSLTGRDLAPSTN